MTTSKAGDRTFNKHAPGPHVSCVSLNQQYSLAHPYYTPTVQITHTHTQHNTTQPPQKKPPHIHPHIGWPPRPPLLPLRHPIICHTRPTAH
mmetsp:Transcript_22633/g.55836  ORF Transcript_22633/g.55836 Transcript_22633/m.55836 type:complete len:91 (+) Transcript_22633:2628-2900(+)